MFRKLEDKFARKFLRRSNGVVYVSEHSLGSKHTTEYNMAGSRLISILDKGQIKHALVNGKRAKPYQKLKQGDVVDVYVPAGDSDSVSGLLITASLAAVAVLVPSPASPFLLKAAAFTGISTTIGFLAGLIAPNQPLEGEGEGEADGSTDRAEIRGSRNTTSKGVLPILFGEHLQTPFYGQRPYRLVGDGSASNKYLQLFIANYSDVNMSEKKLGETLVTDFDSNALTITESQGGASFIGFDNVMPVLKEEQITLDTEQGVFEQSVTTYNDSIVSGSWTYEPIIEFTNVDITNFPDRNFRVDMKFDNGTVNRGKIITSSDLTLVSGTTYRATKIFDSSTSGSNTLISATFYCTDPTRYSIADFDNGLNTRLISEEITIGAYNPTTTVNNDINRYLGVPVSVNDTTPPSTTEVDLIISFPQGLYTQGATGAVSGRSTKIYVEYKAVGAGSYSTISSATSVYVRDMDGVKQPLSSSSTTVSGGEVTLYAPDDDKQANELFFRTIGMELPSGQYVVRVRSADLLEKSTDEFGSPILSEFNFYVDGDTVSTDILPSVNQIAVEAVAYKSLSGELKKYNYLGKLEIPVWNGVDWNTTAETRNPAAIVRYLLTDTKVNPRAEDVSLIDNDTLTDFYNFCDTNNYYADGVITDPTKIGAVVAQILDNAKGGFTLVEGKYVFVFDDPDADVLDMFTPHNSWDFIWSPNAGKTTDALRIQFINEDDYTQDEVTLYYYGGAVHETPDTGTSDVDYEIITQETQFITNRDHIVDRFTYSLTNIQEKRNFFEFKVNLEGLTRRLFDRVYVANTCDMTDEVSGNIKEVVTSGGNITGFNLYSEVDVPAGSSIVIRSIDTANTTSVINTYTVNNSGLTDSIQIDPIPNTGIIKGKGKISGFSSGYEWDYDGDLFEIGVGKVYTALITNIRYNDDLTATIEAREV